MAEKIKFTDEEIKKINDLRSSVAVVFNKLGQLNVEKKRRLKEIEENEDKLLKQHSDLVAVETELFKELNKKYGDGNYDVDTGEFTPIEAPETTTE